MYPPNVPIALRLLDCVRPYVSFPLVIHPPLCLPLSPSVFHLSVLRVFLFFSLCSCLFSPCIRPFSKFEPLPVVVMGGWPRSATVQWRAEEWRACKWETAGRIQMLCPILGTASFDRCCPPGCSLPERDDLWKIHHGIMSVLSQTCPWPFAENMLPTSVTV